VGLPVPGARLIVPKLPAAGERVRLDAEQTRHARARRLSSGDPVVLVDGSGGEAHGKLERFDRGGAEVRVDEIRKTDATRGFSVRLLVASVRAERLAWIAEKATELGVESVVLVESDRTLRFRASESARARLERVAKEAAKRAETARWPSVTGPAPFADAIAGETARHRLLLDPEGEAFPEILEPGAVSLLVGPEGGWTDAEFRAAASAGWRRTSLPSGKLRTETAAVAGIVLARAALARRIPH
jgi:16S rRNA (uracil1498-N3)-methyltransferase